MLHRFFARTYLAGELPPYKRDALSSRKMNSTGGGAPLMLPLPDWAVDAKTIFEYRSFGYLVNFDLAKMGFATYLIVAALHHAFTLRYARKIWWCYLPVITGIGEAVGYIFRVRAVESQELGPMIITTLFLLIPPILLAVVDYEVVAKLLKATGKTIGWINHRNLSRTFVLLDVLCFCIQASSAPLMLSKDPSKQDQGSRIILGGLCFQFLVFVSFVGVAWKVMRLPQLAHADKLPAVKRCLNICIWTILIMLLRNAYRLYEYSLQFAERDRRKTEVILRHEWELYVFEFAPIWAVHVVFLVYNFGWMLPDDKTLAELITGEASTGGNNTSAKDGVAGKAAATLDEASSSSGDGSVAYVNPALHASELAVLRKGAQNQSSSEISSAPAPTTAVSPVDDSLGGASSPDASEPGAVVDEQV